MKYFKVMIVSCCNPDYWYADKIGDVILVARDPIGSGWGYVAKNGASVFTGDVVPQSYKGNYRA